MSDIISLNTSTAIKLDDYIQYAEGGIVSRVLLKDAHCQYTLFCLGAGTEISEHTATKNATVNVLAGRGILILEGKEITLEAGVFVFMKANAPHALKTEENLAFLLTLSAGNE
ncbi:MAG: cupin domain-containing protein [Limnospira sp. PMC 1291.21]|uniref:Cupin type-2 domain-containing protein n=3 Tax=Limnospira TaxID=2596745 RepID=A0A9P1KBJ2_9CYAN|nr:MULTISPECIES: cupin domain-containing protein [Limnospira]EKD10034.1 cupin domain containing protein [Arthrospira platensis C1]MDC0839808.1 cupin domain-containing protein [Limnoraphis robusta]MDY7054292.1 cupin domain-containing protein [Limnospira fusiformis LS22]RAQ39752.1 cupin domain-containing protein [Arthrospira sp. O9.13F]EDZ95435.1 Cupin 2 conserved barrel domain protein [Limnospira maxima CS-328]